MSGQVTRAPLERFSDKVVRDEATGCWLWTAHCDEHGYGRFQTGGRLTHAHRWHYEQLVGAVPDGLELDHLCRVRNCVNPAHIEPVTHRENVLRGEGIAALNAKKTHCPLGHAYDAVRPGGRVCKPCNRIAVRARADRLKAEGRCTKCGLLAAEARTLCDMCLAKTRARNDARRLAAKG